jgi:hypothetical protein
VGVFNGKEITEINCYLVLTSSNLLSEYYRDLNKQRGVTMRDQDWLHGDENIPTIEEEEQMLEQQDKEVREDFFQLVNDVIVDCKFLQSVRDFVPDEDDLEAINALREQLEWHVRRNF